MPEENTEQNKEGKTSIFIIDDDKFLLDMYSLKFRNAGLGVEVAFSSAEAMKRLKEGFAPHIILLDIIMPGMDGIELLKTIRTEKLSPQSTIILLTNQADDADKVQTLGIDGFIIKAMNVPSEVVRQVLDIYKKRNKSTNNHE